MKYQLLNKPATPWITFLFLLAFPLLHAQPANDSCVNATIIDNVLSDEGFMCIEGSNLNATPDSVSPACNFPEFPTVWFQILTDNVAVILNIQVSSSDFSAPTIGLYTSFNGCLQLVPTGLTQSHFGCLVGSQGSVEAIGTNINPNEAYYLAVTSVNSEGGDFQLCINTLSEASVCVVDRNIEITSRSLNGPLTGPFFPGETVSVCMTVNSFNPAGNGCQWFQGLVPVFGNGWDPSSFDIDGQPINASVNGNSIGAAGNGLFGESTWDWFSDVGYHHDNSLFQIYDLDSNGTVDMCNLSYDPQCIDVGGISGGCCGPCWDDAGDILPPGWFAYGINGTCPIPGPPISVDWGDGNSCSTPMGPWSFCFDLIVREFPDCAQGPSYADLSLGFFTFADGETGSWTGGPSVCALDQPAMLTLPFCCTDTLSFDIDTLSPICSGEIIEYMLDYPGVEYWHWMVDAGGLISGVHAGEGGPGSMIHDTAYNYGTSTELVNYTILGFSNGLCPVIQIDVGIDVHPVIAIELNQSTQCDSSGSIVISSSVEGGLGEFDYLWVETGDTTPSIVIEDPVIGTEYTLVVTDDSCTASSTFVITHLEGLVVTIQTTGSEICLQDCPVYLMANAAGGMGAYTYTWTLPDGSEFTGDTLVTCMSGEYVLFATDTAGCAGFTTTFVNIYPQPEIDISISAGTNVICAGDSIQLDALIYSGPPPYNIIWVTPADTIHAISATAYLAGTYTLYVQDGNGCISEADTFITVNDPVLEFGPDTIYSQGEVTLDAGTGWDVYSWNTGESTQTITVDDPGWYFVIVTDGAGCSTSDSIYVDIQTRVEELMPGEFLSVYPNPARDEITIRGELLNTSKIGIEMRNVLGEKIYGHHLEKVGAGFSHKIIIHTAPPGLYFLSIATEKGEYVRKLIVQ